MSSTPEKLLQRLRGLPAKYQDRVSSFIARQEAEATEELRRLVNGLPQELYDLVYVRK
jgi:hypothetical protein